MRTMKNIIALSVLSLLTLAVFDAGMAHAANCSNATITNVLAGISGYCGDSYAYQTDKGSGWICAAAVPSGGSPTAAQVSAMNSLIMSAYLSGKLVDYSLNNTATCSPSSSFGSSTTLVYVHN